MLTHDYWQRRFGGDEKVIGRSITVNSLSTEIIGVMPRGFKIADTDAELIVPFQVDRSSLTLPPFCCQGVARQPGSRSRRPMPISHACCRYGWTRPISQCARSHQTLEDHSACGR
jgi:hypothetical protein